MSLGDMFKKVSAGGASAFNDPRGRIMEEKKAHDKIMEGRETDRMKQEISHKRLEKQRVESNIQRVRRELLHLRTGHQDSRTLSLIRSMEAELRTLESESRTIDSDIRSKTFEVQRHGGMSF